MASQTKATLKSYFNTGDYPTEAQFHNLIDSTVNLQDGGAVAGTTTMTGALNAQNATNYLGLHKFQGFVGTLAGCEGLTLQYADNDALVELGTLDTSVPSGFVAASKFFFETFTIGITTAMSAVLLGNLAVGTASGEATNGALTNPTEVCGAGVASFSGHSSQVLEDEGSVTESDANVPGPNANEIDINFNNTAGNYHIFTPNVTAAIARKFLYARTTTTYGAAAVAGRFTVAAKYSVY